MAHPFAAALRRAAVSLRARDPFAATRVIQKALFRTSWPAAKSRRATSGASTPPRGSAESTPSAAERPATSRARLPLGDVVRLLREGRARWGAGSGLPGLTLPGARARGGAPAVPDGAQFLRRSFASAAGARDYKLYVPAFAGAPRGLVVMLHGCKQDPDDFAVGTGMNAVADRHGLLVAYPDQTGSANPSRCWNWFNPADQARGGGEPAILAGIARELMAEYGLERHQVFIAGLSAGGAMAAVMGATYADVFSAVGIHSGLAHGAANDVVSAFAAMRGEGAATAPARPRDASRDAPRVRTIVFHGAADRVVHPSNADRIVSAMGLPAGGGGAVDERASAGGRSYRRTTVRGGDGATVLESWLVDDAGHAWSGGDPAGSYADAQGPDASAEMARFFLQDAVA